MTEEAKDNLITDPAIAHSEAKVLQNQVTPTVKNAVTGTAEGDPQLKSKIAPLRETGYLELGAQRLAELKAKHPDFYDALMARQEAIDSLTETMQPAHTEIWEGRGLMTPGVAKRRADTVPQTDREKARESALRNAVSTIDFIAQTVDREREKASKSRGHLSEDPIETYDRVNRVIRKEIEDGHTLHEHRIEARQSGALTDGVWATLNVIDEGRKLGPDFSLDISAALRKQSDYDKAVATKAQKP